MKHFVFTAWNVARNLAAGARPAPADAAGLASAPSSASDVRRRRAVQNGYVRPFWLTAEIEPRTGANLGALHVPGSGPGAARVTPYWGIWSLN